MKFKINRNLLPIKAHFFFFFAALGPLLPQINVFGRQLGLSPGVMGIVTAVLPLLWAAAKPLFGYVVDYWPTHRKLVFMLLITIMTGSYCCLWFIPMPEEPPDTTDPPLHQYVYQLNNTVYLEKYDSSNSDFLEKYNCQWTCATDKKFDVYLSNATFINTVFVDDVKNTSCSLLHMDLDDVRAGHVTCIPKQSCDLLCFEEDILIAGINGTGLLKINSTDTLKINEADLFKINDNDIFKINDTGIFKINDTDLFKINDTDLLKVNDTDLFRVNDTDLSKINDTNSLNINDTDFSKNRTRREVENAVTSLNNHIKSTDESKNDLKQYSKVSKVMTESTVGEKSKDNFYMTAVFWAFVVLMCVGTVAFNVANCISDAVCFDVLGPENGSKYGAQRLWGTAGYGVTALLGGWLIDLASGGARVKDFTPAFVVALVATVADLYSCRALTLPTLSSPDDSGKALRDVLKIPRVLLFITFAVVAGTFDSFIIYYMFWFLEELAEQTGHMAQIKLIEGVVIAGQCFIGEILFFALSGRIIRRWGYGFTMTLSLFCYGVRMALISLIQNPWHLIYIESIAQGPTYALCYSTIVGYAAQVAPEGYSATVQGIVAGMDDGVGFAVGSLVGGLLYSWAGGRGAFRVLALTAGVASLLHAALFALVTRSRSQDSKEPSEVPEEGEKMLPVLEHSNAIYRDTVVPLSADRKADR